MSTAEVVRKKGRPKKAAADEILVVAESPIVKPKKQRASRMSVSASEVVSSRPLADGESPTRRSGKKSQPIANVPSQIPSSGQALTGSGDALATSGGSMIAPASSPIIEKASPAFHASRKSNPAISTYDARFTSLPPFEIARPKEPPHDFETISTPESDDVKKSETASNPSKSTFLADFLSSPANPDPWTIKPTKSLSPPSPAPLMAFSRSPAVLAQGSPTQLPPTPSPAAAAAASSSSSSTPPSPPPSLISRRLPPQLPPTGTTRPRLSPKPSETPYEVLRHDPRFKSLSRKYTALMVSIPIALVTSYTLYARYTGQTERKTNSRSNPPLTNGGV